jgi:hypothetical protein
MRPLTHLCCCHVTVIWRPYITLRDGRVIWAKDYGIRAFPITLDDDAVEDDEKPKQG